MVTCFVILVHIIWMEKTVNSKLNSPNLYI